MTPPSLSRDRAWPFLLPWGLGLVVLYLLPAVLAMYYPQTASRAGPSASTGMAESSHLLRSDRLLSTAIVNSIVYTAMSVPAQTLAGLGLATLVRRTRRRGSWTTLFYLPHALAGIATILIWWWLLNPRVGPINSAIRAVERAIGLSAIGAPPWLYSPQGARLSLVLMNAWQAGGVMVIFLAALLRIPSELEEAARLDGCGRFRCFLLVTLPLISHALVFNILTGILAAMQAFNQPYLLANPQQRDSLLFYMLHVYRWAFDRGELGYATLLMGLMSAALLAFTLLVLAAVRLKQRSWSPGDVA